jgi:hypothetical protein
MGQFDYFIDEIKDLVKNPNSMKSGDAERNCKKLANSIIGRDPLKNTSGIINKYTKKDIDELKEYKKLRQKGEEILRNFCVFGENKTDKDYIEKVKEFVKPLSEPLLFEADYWDSKEVGPRGYFSKCNDFDYISKEAKKLIESVPYDSYEYKNKDDIKNWKNESTYALSRFTRSGDVYWQAKRFFCDAEPDMNNYNAVLLTMAKAVKPLVTPPEDVSLDGLRLKPRRKKKKTVAKKRRTKKR